MEIQVKSWGNSLGIRIPKALAQQLGILKDETLHLAVKNNSLIIEKPSYTLDSLLENITDENIHVEQDFGTPIGKEVW